MKGYGKITDYNGSSGTIIDSNGNEYILTEENISYENPQVGDYVYFNIEEFNTIEVHELIATFVKKLTERNE